MNSSFPDWLTPVTWVFRILAVASAVASAVGIAYDIYGLGHRHRHTSASVGRAGSHPLCTWDRWRWPCTPVTAVLARRATLQKMLSIRAAPHNRLP